MIVGPDTVGVGSGVGQEKASRVCPAVIVTSGPVPPPEKVSGSAEAAGL
ncbi:hypothetical protein [Streptomyces sp. 4F14]